MTHGCEARQYMYAMPDYMYIVNMIATTKDPLQFYDFPKCRQCRFSLPLIQEERVVFNGHLSPRVMSTNKLVVSENRIKSC